MLSLRLSLSLSLVRRSRAWDALPHLYRSHDVLLFPSTWEEPLGITLVEAMTCGLPILSTGRAVLRSAPPPQRAQVSVEFRAGDESDLADKALGLLADEDLRQRLARRGGVRDAAVRIGRDGVARPRRRRYDSRAGEARRGSERRSVMRVVLFESSSRGGLVGRSCAGLRQSRLHRATRSSSSLLATSRMRETATSRVPRWSSSGGRDGRESGQPRQRCSFVIPSQVAGVTRRIRETSPAIVHVLNTGLLGSSVVRQTARAESRLVATVHDLPVPIGDGPQDLAHC